MLLIYCVCCYHDVISCSVSQLFLTEGALQLLVVDLDKFQSDPSYAGAAVFIWLDALLCRVPGCAVLVVATHTDRFRGDREKIEETLRNLRGKIDKHVELKKVEWKAAKNLSARTEDAVRSSDAETPAPTLKICGVIEASGCCSDSLDLLRNELCRLAGSDGNDANGRRLFPSVGQVVPKSWARVWAVMSALHQGADVTLAAQSSSQSPTPIDGYEKYNFITVEAVLEAWMKAVDKLSLWNETTRRKNNSPVRRRLVRWSRGLGILPSTATAEEDQKDAEGVFMVRRSSS